MKILDIYGKTLKEIPGETLEGANLRGADLEGADLRDANLRGADLEGADLRDADLEGANLLGADLRGANLLGADLRDAYLEGAYLRGANLLGADLRDAYLRGADLRGADLEDAHLRGADLRGANLRGANLESIRKDVIEILDENPAEVPGLLAAVREGRVDGSTYEGECSCLVGTIASVGGKSYLDLRPRSDRPAERFFFAIKKGDTHANSQVSAIVEGWISAWLEAGK